MIKLKNCRGGLYTIHVRNKKVIPAAVAQRIFQRHFSTKSVDGRGFGTYSIKLLGKTFLGGRASFFSSDRVGTEFRFFLPYKNL